MTKPLGITIEESTDKAQLVYLTSVGEKVGVCSKTTCAFCVCCCSSSIPAALFSLSCCSSHSFLFRLSVAYLWDGACWLVLKSRAAISVSSRSRDRLAAAGLMSLGSW